MPNKLSPQASLNRHLLSIVRFGTREDVKTALKNGADPHARASGCHSTALIMAAAHGNDEAVSVLLPLSDPLARDSAGKTALMVAATKDHEGGVALLLKDGGPLEVDPKGMSSLALAALDGHIGSVLLLLPVSDMTQKNYVGRTAGDYARSCRVNAAIDCRAAFTAFEEAQALSAPLSLTVPSKVASGSKCTL